MNFIDKQQKTAQRPKITLKQHNFTMNRCDSRAPHCAFAPYLVSFLFFFFNFSFPPLQFFLNLFIHCMSFNCICNCNFDVIAVFSAFRRENCCDNLWTLYPFIRSFGLITHSLIFSFVPARVHSFTLARPTRSFRGFFFFKFKTTKKNIIERNASLTINSRLWMM